MASRIQDGALRRRDGPPGGIRQPEEIQFVVNNQSQLAGLCRIGSQRGAASLWLSSTIFPEPFEESIQRLHSRVGRGLGPEDEAISPDR